MQATKGEYTKQARLCAAENKDHIQHLARLCEMEPIDRERRMIERRISYGLDASAVDEQMQRVV